MNDILKEPVEIRLAKAKSKKTDAELLDVLSKDSFWFVRDFVASNPNTSYDTLQYLLEDSDFRVRFEAEKNLKSRRLDEQIKSVREPTKKDSGRPMGIKDTSRSVSGR